MKKLKVAAVVLAGLMVALIVVQWPDIRRYLRLKRM
ncbi:DUF6893 family small protein [Microtetraspora malaysiensis]|uniref:DUF6893 family small protein n=1 Tax=Microtetraspora malaysiensis TaxID=161358 RepID=A0ABW6SUB8_9ACTN